MSAAHWFATGLVLWMALNVLFALGWSRLPLRTPTVGQRR